MARNALVTGGAGFIGSHLVDRLLADGFQVTVLDDLSTGAGRNVNQEATFHEIDINSPDISDVFAEFSPEVVFHLAARVSVVDSVAAPIEEAHVNVIGSINLLQQCKRFGVGRFVFSSTGGALYGEPQLLPCDESHPIQPLSPYGASKAATEAYVNAIAATGGFKYTILRYANVYGPRQNPFGEGGVVAIFAQQMLGGMDTVIYGDGTQQRDFVYVDDIVEANVRALSQDGNHTLNVGTGRATDVNAIHELLSNEFGDAAPAVYREARPGEVNRIYLDASLAQNILGWKATVKMADGISRTAEYFKGANLGEDM